MGYRRAEQPLADLCAVVEACAAVYLHGGNRLLLEVGSGSRSDWFAQAYHWASSAQCQNLSRNAGAVCLDCDSDNTQRMY